MHSCCTGTNANVELSGLPYRAQAGKTGTTDNHTDAWFCGYTPEPGRLRVGRLSQR